MNTRAVAVILIALVPLGGPAWPLEYIQTTLESACCDLDRDGSAETVRITYTHYQGAHPVGGKIIVRSTRRGELLATWEQPKLNPWKLQIADVDGDKRLEVVVGVWKKSPRDPVMAKRVFVYSWNGKRLMPKWLGSRLSRRFVDFALADINRDGWSELAALEVGKSGKRRIALYRWRSFGFDWVACSREIGGLSALKTEGNKVYAVRSGKTHTVRYSKGAVALWQTRG